jgi:hypothetical protein
MRKQTLAVAAAILVSILGATPSYAERSALKANIPFSFTVGNQSLPAGMYVIWQTSTGSKIVQTIQSTDRNAVAIVVTMAVDP